MNGADCVDDRLAPDWGKSFYWKLSSCLWKFHTISNHRSYFSCHQKKPTFFFSASDESLSWNPYWIKNVPETEPGQTLLLDFECASFSRCLTDPGRFLFTMLTVAPVSQSVFISVSCHTFGRFQIVLQDTSVYQKSDLPVTYMQN